MTIEQCYQAMGGDYEAVSKRLPSPRMIEKFALKFLDDPSFELLCSQIQAGNRAEAFAAAHTLKGVCANLAFSRLLSSVEALTEALRPETDTIAQSVPALMEDVRRDYTLTVDAIRAYQAESK